MLSQQMSVIPMEWSEPDSRLGVYFDLFWMGLAAVVFGAAVYWEPFSVTVSITPQRLAGAIILGVILSVALTYFSFVSVRLHRRWVKVAVRFAVICGLIMAGQRGLAVAPTWTVLTVLATVLAAIPLRVAVYLHTR